MRGQWSYERELAESVVYVHGRPIFQVQLQRLSHTSSSSRSTKECSDVISHICMLNQSHSLPFWNGPSRKFPNQHFTISQNLAARTCSCVFVLFATYKTVSHFFSSEEDCQLISRASMALYLAEIKNAKVDKEIVYFIWRILVAQKQLEIRHSAVSIKRNGFHSLQKVKSQGYSSKCIHT